MSITSSTLFYFHLVAMYSTIQTIWPKPFCSAKIDGFRGHSYTFIPYSTTHVTVFYILTLPVSSRASHSVLRFFISACWSLLRTERPRVLKNSLLRRAESKRAETASQRSGSKTKDRYRMTEPKSAMFIIKTDYAGLPQNMTSRTKPSASASDSVIRFMI